MSYSKTCHTTIISNDNLWNKYGISSDVARVQSLVGARKSVATKKGAKKGVGQDKGDKMVWTLEGN